MERSGYEQGRGLGKHGTGVTSIHDILQRMGDGNRNKQGVAFVQTTAPGPPQGPPPNRPTPSLTLYNKKSRTTPEAAKHTLAVAIQQPETGRLTPKKHIPAVTTGRRKRKPPDPRIIFTTGRRKGIPPDPRIIFRPTMASIEESTLEDTFESPKKNQTLATTTHDHCYATTVTPVSTDKRVEVPVPLSGNRPRLDRTCLFGTKLLSHSNPPTAPVKIDSSPPPTVQAAAVRDPAPEPSPSVRDEDAQAGVFQTGVLAPEEAQTELLSVFATRRHTVKTLQSTVETRKGDPSAHSSGHQMHAASAEFETYTYASSSVTRVRKGFLEVNHSQWDPGVDSYLTSGTCQTKLDNTLESTAPKLHPALLDTDIHTPSLWTVDGSAYWDTLTGTLLGPDFVPTSASSYTYWGSRYQTTDDEFSYSGSLVFSMTRLALVRKQMPRSLASVAIVIKETDAFAYEPSPFWKELIMKCSTSNSGCDHRGEVLAALKTVINTADRILHPALTCTDRSAAFLASYVARSWSSETLDSRTDIRSVLLKLPPAIRTPKMAGAILTLITRSFVGDRSLIQDKELAQQEAHLILGCVVSCLERACDSDKRAFTSCRYAIREIVRVDVAKGIRSLVTWCLALVNRKSHTLLTDKARSILLGSITPTDFCESMDRQAHLRKSSMIDNDAQTFEEHWRRIRHALQSRKDSRAGFINWTTQAPPRPVGEEDEGALESTIFWNADGIETRLNEFLQMLHVRQPTVAIISELKCSTEKMAALGPDRDLRKTLLDLGPFELRCHGRQ